VSRFVPLSVRESGPWTWTWLRWRVKCGREVVALRLARIVVANDGAFLVSLPKEGRQAHGPTAHLALDALGIE
jgi:hypothetical protein